MNEHTMGKIFSHVLWTFNQFDYFYEKVKPIHTGTQVAARMLFIFIRDDRRFQVLHIIQSVTDSWIALECSEVLLNQLRCETCRSVSGID